LHGVRPSTKEDEDNEIFSNPVIAVVGIHGSTEEYKKLRAQEEVCFFFP
jgi:hypothetical protein